MVDNIKRIKKILREEELEVFSDEDIQFHIDENSGDTDAAIYDLLIIKSQNDSISIQGLTAADTSGYFRRLAAKYKPNNSRVL